MIGWYDHLVKKMEEFGHVVKTRTTRPRIYIHGYILSFNGPRQDESRLVTLTLTYFSLKVAQAQFIRQASAVNILGLAARASNRRPGERIMYCTKSRLMTAHGCSWRMNRDNVAQRGFPHQCPYLEHYECGNPLTSYEIVSCDWSVFELGPGCRKLKKMQRWRIFLQN